MNKLKVKMNYILKNILYSLLVISIILFFLKFCEFKNIPSKFILAISYLALLFISNILLYLLIKFSYSYKIIKKSSNRKIYIKINLIILFILNTFIYYITYDTLYYQFYNIIAYIIGVTSIFLIIVNLSFLKPIIILIATGLIVFLGSYILGALATTDFSLTSFIFLFGLVFTVIENIEKFINLDTYYPKEITTLENEEIIKRNKVTLNLIIGVLFMLSYIILKLLTIQHIQDKLLIGFKLNVFNRHIGVGLLIIIAIEILIILYLLILTKILKKISVHSKDYDNKTIAELMYSILTFGINKNVEPKVIDKIVIGYNEIDQVDPEVFITNIRGIPKDIHILLTKVEDTPNIRKLIIIYPNKDVYSYKFTISKHIITRI